MYRSIHTVLLIGSLLFIGCGKNEIPFEIDKQRAFEHVSFLADSIGPRVPGTIEDERARNYIAAEMERVGLDVERQYVPSVWAGGTYIPQEREVRVDSENIIGRIPGKSDRTILISGHFDSSGRSVPGANDNASSIGVLLEVARAIVDYDWNMNIVFAAFGAEERGLLGSKYYVENTDLRDLILAINMDPVGYDKLYISPMPDVPPLPYQRELVRLARTYGLDRVAVDPMQILVPRYLPLGFGADHMSFLDAGYPAISINNTLAGWNYHTTHDKTKYIEPETLQAAAELVIAFLLEYDDNKEPPVVESPVYVAQPVIGNIYVFITDLYLLILVGGSLLAFLYFGFTERHSIKTLKLFGFIILFLKMLFLAFIQVLFIFLPVFGGMILERTLYPWMANPLLYMAMGIASGMVGLFFILQIAALLKLEPEMKHLKYWAILILLLYTVVAFSFLGIDVAYYFAAPMLLFLITLRINSTLWSLLIGGVGIFPLLGSVGPSQISMAITLLGVTIPVFSLMVTVYVLSLPFIFYFAAALQGDDATGETIREVVSHPGTPAAALLLFIGLYYWSYTMDVYTGENPQLINQSAVFDLNTEEGTLFLSSYDYLPLMQDEISGQFIEPDDIMVSYPLEVEPGLTDLVTESETIADTLMLFASFSIPAFRDYVSIELNSTEPFEVLNSEYDVRRENRNQYVLDVLSAEGDFTDTLIVRRNAPVRVQFDIHTFDASEQPQFTEITHPLSFRYHQRMRAMVAIE